MADLKRTYENVQKTIESLIAKDSKGRTKEDQVARQPINMPRTREFCKAIGIEEDLDKLSVIHVAGTKGKGSTCAFTERILREHRYKTGFFSSPHLVEYRERVRINGKPLPREKFAEYFYDVYDKLVAYMATTKHKLALRMFELTTVLCFRIFLEEKVDVVVLEVGVGGELDYTNVVRNPVVCGITTLDYDHVDVLGTTMASIAWHKAGIMKDGVPAFTHPQPEEALNVIAERAMEKKCPLHLVPEFSTYGWGGQETNLGIPGDIQKWNASLAIQLSNAWLQLHEKPEAERRQPYERSTKLRGTDIPVARTFLVPYQTRIGLRSCVWPGRHQTIKRENVTYYIDAAHTQISIEHCVDWFSKEMKVVEGSSGPARKILIYNIYDIHDRPVRQMLQSLQTIGFDAACFCRNITHVKRDEVSQQYESDAMKLCHKYRAIWLELNEGENDAKKVITAVLPSALDALIWAGRGTDSTLPGAANVQKLVELPAVEHTHILLTGSMGLVGCALKLLDTNINE